MAGMKKTVGPNRVVGAIVAVFACAAMAHWSTDALINNLIAGGSGDQGVPLVGACPDGSVFVSYFENTGTGYKPMLQRVHEGHMQFASPIQLADRHNTATFIYDMKIDPSGNAIVAFDGDSAVTVHKVFMDGTIMWGATGLQIPGTTGVLAPRVVACADNTYVVAWASSNVINFQRISETGTLVGPPWTYSETGHYLAMCDLLSTGTGGEFISLWVRGETTSATTSRKGLQMQKWSSAGTAMWNGGTPMAIYTSSQTPLKSIQNGYFPTMQTDFDGGAIVAWYDNGASRNSWLQHVRNDGTMRFAAEGLGMTTVGSATEFRLSATAAYDFTNDAYTVAWQRSNTIQSQFGLNAQRVTSTGSLLWGDSGAVVVPMGGFQSSLIQAFPGPGGKSYLMWQQYTGATTQEIQATQLDGMGMMTWPNQITRMSTRVSTKGKLGAVKATSMTELVGVWAEGPFGSQDIYAQNVNFDGTLGPRTCEADFNGDGAVDFFDYLDFVQMFSWQWETADFNHDEVIDFFDYLDFVQAFNTGC